MLGGQHWGERVQKGRGFCFTGERNAGRCIKMNVIATFLCPLAWAMGVPETWSHVILAVSVKAFLDEVNI